MISFPAGVFFLGDDDLPRLELYSVVVIVGRRRKEEEDIIAAILEGNDFGFGQRDDRSTTSIILYDSEVVHFVEDFWFF